MALYCLVSAGGSPGVTTTGMALALCWPREVILAECDPAGRRVLPGFLVDRLETPPGPGLLGLAMALDREPNGTRLEDHTIPFSGDGRARLLHGIRDPRHATQLVPLWQPLADLFRTGEADVIADLGRIGGPDTPAGLLTQANLVVMVIHRTLPQVDAARPRLDALLRLLDGTVPVALCLIESGRYSAPEVSRVLFDLPVLAELPHAPADARVLSDGARPRITFRTSLLVRMAGALGQQMRTTIEEHAPRTGSEPAHAASGDDR